MNRSRHLRLDRVGCAVAVVIAGSACTRPTAEGPIADPVAAPTSVALVPTLPPPITPPAATVGGPPVTSVMPGEVSSSTTLPDAASVPSGIADITMTSVPSDVIVPSDTHSLNDTANPINGARGGPRPVSDDVDCAPGAPSTCLVPVLDQLGFDVTSGPASDSGDRIRRAIAVVQLDAGLDPTGEADHALLGYLGVRPPDEQDHHPDEVRVIGSSVLGRPITAVRYGDGARTVLVVGQTHGDEEAGLRVLLRARRQPIPDDVALWMIPTMNPDGGFADSRFQDDGANLNRDAPSQPEQRVVYDFALEIEPSLTVWYHQNYGWVGASGASFSPAQQYQALTGLGTLHRSGDCAKGFMWCPIDEALNSSSILVELPDVVSPADVQIHATALLAVAADNDP